MVFGFGHNCYATTLIDILMPMFGIKYFSIGFGVINFFCAVGLVTGPPLASRYYRTLALSDPHREKGDETLQKQSKNSFSQNFERFCTSVRMSQIDSHLF